MRPVREAARPTTRPLPAVLLLALAACAGPGSEYDALARIFWVAPASLRAETVTPEGLGVEAPVRLVMSLTGVPGQPPLKQRFNLVPEPGTAQGSRFRLAAADYRRFTAFQQKVVASFGSVADFVADLEVPYCSHPGRAAGSGAPVARLIDGSNGQIIMSRAAEKTARDLQPALPDCE